MKQEKRGEGDEARKEMGDPFKNIGVFFKDASKGKENG